MQAIKSMNQYPHSRESLRELDPETVIDMFLSLDAKYQQLGDYARDLVAEKYGPKTERFNSPGQLLIFPNQSQNVCADSETETTASSASGSHDSNTALPIRRKKQDIPATHNRQIFREFLSLRHHHWMPNYSVPVVVQIVFR